jgi:hypothetical protein
MHSHTALLQITNQVDQFEHDPDSICLFENHICHKQLANLSRQWKPQYWDMRHTTPKKKDANHQFKWKKHSHKHSQELRDP